MTYPHYPDQAPYNHPQAPAAENHKPETPKWVKWGGASVVAAIAIGGAAYGTGRMFTKGVQDELGVDKSTSAPAVPGTEGVDTLSTIDGTQLDVTAYPYKGDYETNKPAFEDLPLGTQLDAAVPYVDAHIQQWYDEYRARVKKNFGQNAEIGDRDENGNVLPLPPVSEHNTAKEITLRNLAITHGRWNNVDANLGRNIVSAQTMPGTDEYDHAVSTIADDKGGFHAPMSTANEEALPTFTEGSFHGIQANGRPTKVLLVTNPHTGETFVNIYQLHTGANNPNAKAWLLMDAGGVEESIGREYYTHPSAP